MKKFVFSILIFIFVVFGVVFAQGSSKIGLFINGSEISCDVAPIIENSRTLVPVRAVFEGLDADVSWDNDLKQATVEKANTTMKFTIGSKKAILNGETHSLDAAPVILQDRCLIPIRFVSEKLGYDVDWDNDSRSVLISEKSIAISGIKISKGTDFDTVTIVTNSDKGPTVSTLSNPYRIIFDFENASLSIDDNAITVKSHFTKYLRYASHDGYARIVAECQSTQPYTVIKYSKGYAIRIGSSSTKYNPDDDENLQSGETEEPKRDANSVENLTDEDISNINTKLDADNLLVVIDAGHGGSDPGAVAEDEEGNILLEEKTPNLQIALGVAKILNENGVNVQMTRSTDKFVSLTDIAAFANNKKADMFVSIHNNSFTDSSASGTLVMYNNTIGKMEYGISSRKLARYIQDELVDAINLQDRGLVNGSKILVLNRTNMPSVLVECGFITNDKDREILASKDGIDKIAKAIAEGIMSALSEQKANIEKAQSLN